MKNSNNILGKKVDYPNSYNADLLVRILRSENRIQYDITDSDKLFEGLDIWHAWEFGFLTSKGYPVTGVLKIIYPSDNDFIVESKSLKLYFNSFNMSKFGVGVEDGLDIVLETVKSDLQDLLMCNVTVSYFSNVSKELSDFNEYKNLDEIVNVDRLEFDDFIENPKFLKDYSIEDDEYKIYSDALRSNCKVTFQPDWGSVFIYMKSGKKINRDSLLKYIVSFRNENHFHEEVCEVIYKRLSDIYSPEKLMVCCIYTRRGGIDISPVRVSDLTLLPQHLISEEYLSQKLYRQ